jgi:hypothetical protein
MSTAWPNRPAVAPGGYPNGPQFEELLDRLEAAPQGVLENGYANRQTNSTGTTSIVGVVRLDNALLKTGRTYRIYTSALRATAGAGDAVEATIRVSTSGAATTGSTAIATDSQDIDDAATFEGLHPSAIRIPGSDETLSALLCIARTAGAGSASLGGAATYPIELIIEDVGAAVTDTGTDI